MWGYDAVESCIVSDLFKVQYTGICPAATIAGLYIAHPQSRYFLIGRISEEQLHNYAIRRKCTFRKNTQILASKSLVRT